MSEGTWTHDHPITYEKAQGFGLPVRCDIPSEFLDLMNLYPQPVRRQPTVGTYPNTGATRVFEATVTDRPGGHLALPSCFHDRRGSAMRGPLV